MVLENKLSVSVVIPVYSGEELLEMLVERIIAVGDFWFANSYPIKLQEIILVDDAAIDGSPEVVDRMSNKYPMVTAIHLMRNFGQHAATIAGCLRTSGDWVVTMDEDLQHRPENIALMFQQVAKTSSDVVYASPEKAVHEKPSRDLSSRMFKRALSVLSGNSKVRLFNSFRLLRGDLARAASNACGHESYLDVVLLWFTDRVETVSMPLSDIRVINGGSSGYGLRTLLSHSRRMIITSRIKLLRFGALTGALALVTSILLGSLVVIDRIFFEQEIVAGWASLAVIGLFFGGLITFLLGLILEYLATVVLWINGKPIFYPVDRSSDRYLDPLLENASRQPELSPEL